MITAEGNFVLRSFLRFFLQDQRGVTTIEYGLIVMAIALACLTTYFLAGDALKEIMMHAVSGFEQAQSTIDENTSP